MGKTRDPEGIKCVKKKFLLEGLLSVTLTPMGGNLVLIKVQDGAIFEEVLRNNEEEFSRWFVEIRPWNSNMVATSRSIWLKILGVPAHIWNENFFRQISQLVGSYISIDDSTRDKMRLDIARVLINTSVKEIINTVVEVKVNGIMYNIRMLEESFGDNMSRFLSDWKYQNSDGNSSDDDDSMANSVLRVPETEMFAGIGEDDIDKLNKEFLNSLFGKSPTPEEKSSNRGKSGRVIGGALGGKDVQSALHAQKDLTLGKSGDVHVSNTISTIQKARRILESPTILLDELGHRVKFVEESELGLTEKQVAINKNVGIVEGASTQSNVVVEKQGGLYTECLTEKRCGELENQMVIGLDEIHVLSDGLVGETNKTHCITIRESENFTVDDIQDSDVGVVYHNQLQNGATNKEAEARKGRSRKKALQARLMSSAFLATQCVKTPLEVHMNDGKNNDAQNNVAVVDDRESRRAAIAAGKKHLFQNSGNYNPTQVSDPISGSKISTKDRACIRAEAYREANNIWIMGKEIGMTATQDEGDIIQALVEMEERDSSQCKENEKDFLRAGVQTVS